MCLGRRLKEYFYLLKHVFLITKKILLKTSPFRKIYVHIFMIQSLEDGNFERQKNIPLYSKSACFISKR